MRINLCQVYDFEVEKQGLRPVLHEKLAGHGNDSLGSRQVHVVRKVDRSIDDLIMMANEQMN